MEIAERVTVLRDGARSAPSGAARWTTSKLAMLMTGKEFALRA